MSYGGEGVARMRVLQVVVLIGAEIGRAHV